MHAILYILACIAAIASVAAMPGPPASVALVSFACVMIAVVGVPHGGLDHWTGRRKLQPLLRRFWAPVFFLSYLVIAGSVAVSWVAFPTVTVLAFFAMSAWHFGREDQASEQNSRPPTWATHLSAFATGGLVISVPALFRSAEMQSLLLPIVGGNESSAFAIVQATQVAAWVLVPTAVLAWVRTAKFDSCEAIVIPLTIAVAAATPVLVSFTIYFCGWHSIQGLMRLRREERLTWKRFALSVAPLSLLAVGGIATIGTAGWLDGRALVALSSSDALQMTFIGLASIAVPHVLVHEWLDKKPPLTLAAWSWFSSNKTTATELAR